MPSRARPVQWIAATANPMRLRAWPEPADRVPHADSRAVRAGAWTPLFVTYCSLWLVWMIPQRSATAYGVGAVTEELPVRCGFMLATSRTYCYVALTLPSY